ncbi:hypothetical protein [Jannaschia sp. M317]|uniref:hypothetical protein n=1 Tax=Jannaschia sp. M317 TaxID=2867011 RepID=UPI0021A5B056|nr:hypothetical protein [Jannaschia sp. M317]UWQ17780.1 hypothetical protein K3551_00210 [Jannaschia sp. M317]
MTDVRPTPDHGTAPPNGSSHAAVDAPRSSRAKWGLAAMVGLIVAILLVAFLFADEAPEGAEAEGVIVPAEG